MKREKGFTLLEILITLAIIAIAFPVLLRFLSQNISLAAEAEFLSSASLLADSKMNDLCRNGYLESGPVSGRFEAPDQQFEWKLSVGGSSETDVSGLQRLELTVTLADNPSLHYSIVRYVLPGEFMQSATGTPIPSP